MPRKGGGGSDPALAIEFFLSGFYTHRSQLFAPFRNVGITVAVFRDPVIDGRNQENTDLYEWSRRPGFSIFCDVPLTEGEIVNQFDSSRNFDGTVTAYFDSNQRLAEFTPTSITTIITKTTAAQGYLSAIGNMTYFSDGASVDMQKWDSATSFPTTINPSSWGLPAPTLTPTIYNRGCWLPLSQFMVNNAILDPNGNVEVVTYVVPPAGISGVNQPPWPTTPVSTINDGSIQWTNMGPLEIWLPDQNYPVPVVVLDTNGNLQLATTTNAVVVDWDAGATYGIGDTVFFAGNYWTSLVAGNTGIAPSSAYTVLTGGTTQPYWVLAQNPITTGSVAPTWSTAVGSQTVDNDYTWTNLGPGALIESFGTSYVYCFRTIYGHLSTASPISINTGSIFGPQVATITQFNIQGNVVTFQGTNNFVPGNVFTVTGLTKGMYLNNVPFIISPIGLSPTQFSASFLYPNLPMPVMDSGTTVNLVAAVTGQGTTSPLCNANSNITATEVVADVVTIYSVNNFVPGLQITFSGLTVATFLNNQQFQIINVDPDGLWFQVYFITPNQSKATDTGLATFNAVEVYRTSDGGGIYLFSGAVTNPIPSATPIQPYDSGDVTAGIGQDSGTPGTHVWVSSNNVTSTSLYASIAVPTPGGGGGGSRFSVLQTCQNIFSGPVSSGIQAMFGLSVTALNSILVFVNTFQVTSWTVTDTQGNVYNLIAQHTDGNQSYVSVYLATGVAAGPTTVKLNVIGVGSLAWFGFGALECNGLSGVVETPAYNFQTRGTTFDTGDITTSDANAVVFTSLWSDLFSGPASTPPAAYTLATNQVVTDSAESQQPVQQQAVAYQLQSATGSFSPIWDTPSGLKALGVTVALDLALFTPGDALNVFDFGFGIPPTVQITGIEIDLEGYFTGTLLYGSYEVQLLKAGSPFGVPMVINPTNANVNYMLGGANNLWGGSWMYSDFNSANWGVQITPVQLTGGSNATFYVRNVRARLTGSLNTAIWVYNDFTTDANLNELLIAPQNHLNDPPPGAPGSSINAVGTITAYWQGRIWMVVGNYVYFDAGPDCINGVPEEAWPPANRFQFVGPVLALERTADGVGLLVYLADRVNAILGGPETISFYATDALSNFGISSPNCIFRDGSIIGQFTTQKQYFELLGGQKQEIGEHIADYLAANFDPTKSYVTMHRNGTDVGVFISNGVDQVIRYGSNIAAWSVPAFPVGGAGALQSIETSVGVTSLMLAQPPIGGSTPPAPPSPPAVSVGIQNALVQISSAQLKAIGNTGVIQLIPAQGANLAIIPISCMVQVNFVTTAYTTDMGPVIGFGTTQLDIDTYGYMMFLDDQGHTLFTSSETLIQFVTTTGLGESAGAYDPATYIVNQPLNWANGADISSDPGDATITLNIQYLVVNVTTGQIVGGTGKAVTGVLVTLTSTEANSMTPTQLVALPGSANRAIIPISTIGWFHATTDPANDLINLQPNLGSNSGFAAQGGGYGVPVTPSAILNQPFAYIGGLSGHGEQTAIGWGITTAEVGASNVGYLNSGDPSSWVTSPDTLASVGAYVQYMIIDLTTGVIIPGQGDVVFSFIPISSTQLASSTPIQLSSVPCPNTICYPVSYVVTSDTSVPYNTGSGQFPQPSVGPGYAPFVLSAFLMAPNFIENPLFTQAGNQIIVGTPQIGSTVSDVADAVGAPIQWGINNSATLSPGDASATANVGIQYLSISTLTGKIIFPPTRTGPFSMSQVNSTLETSSAFSGTYNTPIFMIGTTVPGDTYNNFSVYESPNNALFFSFLNSSMQVIGSPIDASTLSGTVTAPAGAAYFYLNTVGAFTGGVYDFSCQLNGLNVTYGVSPDANPINFDTSFSSEDVTLFPVAPILAGGSFLGSYTTGSPNIIFYDLNFNILSTTVFGLGTNVTAPANTAYWSVNAALPPEIATNYQLSYTTPCSSPPPPPTVGSYLLARDLTTWQDQGHSNMSDGHNYPECYITIGSITLSQPGAPMFPLQHVVLYLDAVGTLNNGGSSYPDVWILPNEISDTKGVGFVYLPEVLQEPPEGTNNPSTSLLSLRWPVNMVNSAQMSQFLHHCQIKVLFEPENAPNTLKAMAFKTEQI